MPYLSADCIRSAAKAENLMDGMQFADNGTQIDSEYNNLCQLLIDMCVVNSDEND